MKEKSPVFVEKWQEEIELLKRVIENMHQAVHEDTTKIQSIQKEIDTINEVIQVES